MTYKKINRNSLGQFLRSRQKWFHISARVYMDYKTRIPKVANGVTYRKEKGDE